MAPRQIQSAEMHCPRAGMILPRQWRKSRPHSRNAAGQPSHPAGTLTLAARWRRETSVLVVICLRLYTAPDEYNNKTSPNSTTS